MSFANSGIIGANYSLTGTTAKYALGQTTEASDGQKWVYIFAQEDLPADGWVLANKSFQALKSHQTEVVAGYGTLAVTPYAIASGSYGWAVYDGTASAKFNTVAQTTISAGLAVGISATATGALSLYTTSTQIQVGGVMTTAAASGAVTVVATLNNPHLILPRN